MAKDLKKMEISFLGDKPMQFTDRTEDEGPALTQDQKRLISLIGEAVRAYREASNNLLTGKYSHLKKFVPEYLADPGNVLVVSCDGGLVIRYDKSHGTPKVFNGWMSEDLPEVVAMLSQNLIQCHPSKEFRSTIEKTGIEIKLSSVDSITSQTRELLSFRVGFDVVVERPGHFPIPPHKPFCLSSVRNTLELELYGELVSEGEQLGEGQRILIRNKVRLPVGWECIEIFPYTDVDQWKPEYAPAWAETDILASVVAHQLQESHFQSLDPLSSARDKFASLLRDFKALLDSEPEGEEALQSFLRDTPYLLCPTHTNVWPKLALGSNITDFVFRDATSEYLLVELEKSTHSLFRKDGHPRSELNVALGQITDWKRYLGDNVKTVQGELGLSGISVDPPSMVVIGRSATLSAENMRKLKAMNDQQPRLRVMTYDDVYENAKAVIENLFGPIWESVGETQIYYLK